MVDENSQERDVQDIRGRRAQAIAATAVAALLLVGTTACGGSSSDGASGSDGGTKTTQDSGSGDSGSDDGGSDSGGGELPDPCDLVPIETASEILGGESAEPEGTGSDTGVASRSCSWQTQAGKDNPTLDGAGHILTLNVTSPPATMSMDDFWTASKDQADEELDIDGCDEGFLFGGMVNGRKGDVYLTATAGLADTSPEAQQSATDLVAAACANA